MVKKSRSLIVLCIVLMLFGLMGCGSSKEKQNVLVVLGSQGDVTYKDTEKAAKQWAEEKNISLQVVAPKLSTVYEQQKVLENSMRENKWDLIVIEPLGSGELYPVLDYAKQQGSLVVAVQGSPKIHADYTIQPCDYKQLGTSMMDLFAEKMGNAGSYVTVVPTKDSEMILEEELACITQQKNQYQRMMAVSRLQEGSDIKSVYHMADALSEAYDMKGILFFSYIDGLGISQWKQNTGNDLIAVGIGPEEVLGSAVDDGTINAFFYWDRENLLRSSLEVGYKAMEGSISNDSDVITTKIDGYRTLRSLGDGIYYGNDMKTADKEE